MRRSLLLSLAAELGFLFCSIVSGAEPTPEQATVCGMIVDGKGMAVAGVEVKVLLDRSIISARSDGLGKFQVGVPKNQAAQLAILATASSGIGVLRLHGESDASRTENLRVQLVESRPLEVSVTDKNKRPIAGARVGALVDQVELPFSETSAQGKASLQLPVRRGTSRCLLTRQGVDWIIASSNWFAATRTLAAGRTTVGFPSRSARLEE